MHARVFSYSVYAGTREEDVYNLMNSILAWRTLSFITHLYHACVQSRVAFELIESPRDPLNFYINFKHAINIFFKYFHLFTINLI